MNATTTYKQEALDVRSVRYTGNEALKDGYLVCWNRDSTSAVDLAGKETADATVRNHNRFREVEKPAAGNLHNFAGVVFGNYGAKTGGQEIRIAIPRNQSVDLYTDQNCVAGVTLLCVQAGSFLAGPIGSGPVIARAVQTVDRSGTNGLVQCVADMPNPLIVGSATGRLHSPFWESCPLDLIRKGVVNGFEYFNDFLGNYVLANNKTVQHLDSGIAGYTAATAGTTLSMPADEPTGVCILNSRTTKEDAGISALGGLNTAGQVLLKGRRTWIEGRVKLGPDKPGKDDAAAFFGLAEERLAAKGGVLGFAGAMNDKDYLGFYHVQGEERWDAVYNTAGGGAARTHVADAHVSVADTYVKLGIYCDGTSVYFYVNGVQVGDALALTAAEVPDDQAMAFYFVLMNVGGGAPAEAAIDWVHIAQLL